MKNGVDKNVGTAKNGKTGIDKNVETYIKCMSSTDMNIPPLPPKGEDGEKKKRRVPSMPSWKPERFEGFYDFYRRKVMPKGRYPSRLDAAKEWDKLKPDDATINAIGKALRIQMQSEDWKRGIGIPDPCRYLSHRRWEDAEEAEEDAPHVRRFVRMEVVDGEEVAVYE